NVGSTSENYRVREIARIIADAFPGCKLTFGNSDGDNRSYRVSFDKVYDLLPGFKCEKDARLGAQELFDLFQRINMTRELFDSRPYTRLKQLQHLLQTKQLDDDFCWTTPVPSYIRQPQQGNVDSVLKA